jgi:hypothetical protein
LTTLLAVPAAPARRLVRRAAAALALAACALPVAGCLGAPEIEDRWTRIDLESANHAPNQAVTPGVRDSVAITARITYRSILTGFAVAELRASNTVANGSVTLDPDASREPMAYDIDRILANSVSVGRTVRPVTGWDHLVQTLDLSFAAVPPASIDTTGATSGLFLLCYLGSGEEIELRDGSDSIAITPFVSTEYRILPVGMKLTLGAVPAP